MADPVNKVAALDVEIEIEELEQKIAPSEIWWPF